MNEIKNITSNSNSKLSKVNNDNTSSLKEFLTSSDHCPIEILRYTEEYIKKAAEIKKEIHKALNEIVYKQSLQKLDQQFSVYIHKDKAIP